MSHSESIEDFSGTEINVVTVDDLGDGLTKPGTGMWVMPKVRVDMRYIHDNIDHFTSDFTPADSDVTFRPDNDSQHRNRITLWGRVVTINFDFTPTKSGGNLLTTTFCSDHNRAIILNGVVEYLLPDGKSIWINPGNHGIDPTQLTIRGTVSPNTRYVGCFTFVADNIQWIGLRV